MGERAEEGGPYSIPLAVYDGLKDYRETGCPQGGFVKAVLENNLTRAFMAADPRSTIALRDIVLWCYWNLPEKAWGSPKRYADWIETHEKARLSDSEPPSCPAVP